MTTTNAFGVSEHTDNNDSTVDNHYTEDIQYKCPYCAAVYGDERIARVHITRADDADHQNRNGMMPEAEIEVVDTDGTAVDTISRHPKEIDLDELTVDHFPEKLTDKRRYALLVASQNPHEDTRRELTQLVQNRVASDEVEIEPPVERTVGRALDDFFHPQQNTSTDDAATETLADLKPLQQAIVIGRLTCPGMAKAGIAERVGCCSTYPGQLFDRKSRLMNNLSERTEAGESPEEIIKTELCSDAIEQLVTEEFTTDLPINLSELAVDPDDNDGNQEQPDVNEATVAGSDETGSGTSPEPGWGSPTTDHGVVRATPSNPLIQSPDPDRTNGRQETLSMDDSSTGNGTGNTTTSTTSAAEGIDKTSDANEGENGHKNSGTEVEANTASTEMTGDQPPVVDTLDKVGAADINKRASESQPSVVTQPEGQDLIAEVEALRANVAFMRRTVSPTTQSDGATALLESFAEQVEQQCKAIVQQAHNES